jgi:hypothetical protein
MGKETEKKTKRRRKEAARRIRTKTPTTFLSR